MVDVDAHPERMILRQHRAKLGRDALWQENRNSRPDTNEFDVWNRSKPSENLIELIIAEEQCVSTAQQNIAHFGVNFQVTIDRFKFGMQLLLAHAADDPAPGAISAVTRASIRH